MDGLDQAINRALEAAQGHACEHHVRRAAALARFPTRRAGRTVLVDPAGLGEPQPPERPVLPTGDDELSRALEELAYQLVWAADCAEFTDATNNARQFLQAAGHVTEATRPCVGDLAAAYGLDLGDLVPAMGMFPPHAHVHATFAWDMHHEHPITDPDDLGRRELLSYRVGDLAWDKPQPQPKPVMTSRELAWIAPVNASNSLKRSTHRTPSPARSTST